MLNESPFVVLGRLTGAVASALLLAVGFSVATALAAVVAPAEFDEVRGAGGEVVGAVGNGLWVLLDWWAGVKALWFGQTGEPERWGALVTDTVLGGLLAAGACLVGWTVMILLLRRGGSGLVVSSPMERCWVDTGWGGACIGLGAGLLCACVLHEGRQLFGGFEVSATLPWGLGVALGAMCGVCWAARAAWLGAGQGVKEPVEPRAADGTDAGTLKGLIDWAVVGNEVGRPASAKVAGLIKRAVLLLIGAMTLFSAGRVGTVVNYLRFKPDALGAGALVRPGHDLLIDAANLGQWKLTNALGPEMGPPLDGTGSGPWRELHWKLSRTDDGGNATEASRWVTLAAAEETRVEKGPMLLGVSWKQWRGEVYLSVAVYPKASVKVVE